MIMTPSIHSATGGSPRHAFLRGKRSLWLPVAILLPILAVLGWICWGLEPEPLTSEEILAKERWSPEELSRTMGHVFSPQRNRNNRDEVIDHMRRQLAKYGPDEQRTIRIEAMQIAVRNGLAQFRSLPANQRSQMIQKMQEDAGRNLAEVQRRSSELNQQLNVLENTDEGRAVTDEVTRIVVAELSVAERREFSGLINQWVKILNVRKR